MPNAVIEDWEQFNAFLAAQPLFKWLEQKQQQMAIGMHNDQGRSAAIPAPKDDNAELAAALSSMA